MSICKYLPWWFIGHKWRIDSSHTKMCTICGKSICLIEGFPLVNEPYDDYWSYTNAVNKHEREMKIMRVIE